MSYIVPRVCLSYTEAVSRLCRYNLALVCSLEAERILQLAPADRSLAEVERAVALMTRAQRAFAWLAGLNDAAVSTAPNFVLAGVAAARGERGPRMSRVDARARADFLEKSLAVARVHVEHQRTLHAKSLRDAKAMQAKRAEQQALKQDEKKKCAVIILTRMCTRVLTWARRGHPRPQEGDDRAAEGGGHRGEGEAASGRAAEEGGGAARADAATPLAHVITSHCHALTPLQEWKEQEAMEAAAAAEGKRRKGKGKVRSRVCGLRLRGC